MELLGEHFIRDKSFKDSSDLISYVSKILYREGFVKKGFRDALIQREEEFPTGVEAEINFAIPHSESKHVNKSTFTIIIPDETIEFKSMINPNESINAKIIVVMVLKEKEEHIDFLKRVIQLFQKPKQLEVVLKSDKNEQFNYFKDYFERDTSDD